MSVTRVVIRRAEEKKNLPKFAVDVRQTRISRGFTLSTLATKIKSSTEYLSMLESGSIANPGMLTFIKPCDVLGLQPQNYGPREEV